MLSTDKRARAVCEAMAHLQHMLLSKRLSSRPDEAGVMRFYPAD